MSVTGKKYDTNTGVRKITLTTNPELHPLSNTNSASQNYYCLGLDQNGFQYQIDLQALPAGITLEQIKQNQVWWVEKRTTLFRPYLYAGLYNPTTRQIDSTAPLPAPSVSNLKGITADYLIISGNTTISGNTAISNNLTVGNNLTVNGTITGGITSNYFAGTLGSNFTMTNANTNYTWLTTSSLASGIWMLNVQAMFYTTSTTAVCAMNLGTSSSYTVLGPIESELTTNGNDATLNLSTIVQVATDSTVTLNARSSVAGVVIYQNGRAFGIGAITGYTAVRIA